MTVRCTCGGSLWRVKELRPEVAVLGRAGEPKNQVQVRRPYFDTDFEIVSWGGRANAPQGERRPRGTSAAACPSRQVCGPARRRGS